MYYDDLIPVWINVSRGVNINTNKHVTVFSNHKTYLVLTSMKMYFRSKKMFNLTVKPTFRINANLDWINC